MPRLWSPPLRELTPETTRGFECIAFAEDVLGITLHPWQKWALLHILELLPDGSFRWRTALLLVARQNGKTTLLQVIALWRMYVDGADLVLGTAQDLDLAEDTWRGAVEMAQGVPELNAEILHVDMTNGKKQLRLDSGQRYKVKAASRRAGRGLSGDEVLMDELREQQTWDAWGAISKTTMARPFAQILGFSNAGDAKSVVLSHLRTQALKAITDGDESSRIGIFEWSALEDCALDDRNAWAQANPSLGYTIQPDAIMSALETDPEAVFRTEVLCQWVENIDPPDIAPEIWSSRYTTRTLPDGPVTLGVDFAPHATSAAIVACAGGIVEVVDHHLGTAWVPRRLTELMTEHDVIRTGVDPAQVPGAIADEFNAPWIDRFDGRRLTQATTSAIASFTEGGFAHRGQPELDAAAVGAKLRVVGDSSKWSRRDSTVDITPLVAATIAAQLWVENDYSVLDSVPG